MRLTGLTDRQSEPSRPLTNREWQVIALLAKGWSNKRIAEHLRKNDGGPLAVRTVEAHIENVAAILPNPDGIAARTLVMLWARDRAHAA